MHRDDDTYVEFAVDEFIVPELVVYCVRVARATEPRGETRRTDCGFCTAGKLRDAARIVDVFVLAEF